MVYRGNDLKLTQEELDKAKQIVKTTMILHGVEIPEGFDRIYQKGETHARLYNKTNPNTVL